jgi:hypothetical protein
LLLNHGYFPDQSQLANTLMHNTLALIIWHNRTIR